MPGPAEDVGALAEIQKHFARFEESFPDLRLYRRLAAGCTSDLEVAGLLLAARPGQGRPVLLFAAVHELVLRRPDLPLARWYGSVTPLEELAGGDPWPVFRRTVLENRRDLEAVIASHATQTNEVNRSVLVAVLLAAACADAAAVPVRLVELGASAGLLLTPDRYRVDVGGDLVGDADSSVHLGGVLRGGRVPDLSTFPRSFTERIGIDRDPISVTETDRVRWLEACLWPDQPWRVERFRAAVELVRADPPRLIAGDMIGRLPEVLEGADEDHLVLMNLWSLTYVARDDRDDVAMLLDGAAGSHRMVSWITAEPPGCVPGIDPPRWNDVAVGPAAEARPDTVLGLRRWRAGREVEPVALGWSHPHGNWIELTL